jgi:carbon-monoxide dehydrogenase medium subunit
VIPAPFVYHRASDPDDAVAVLASAGGEAKLLAGGQSLLPMMKLRLARPDLLVDVSGLRDLNYLRADGAEVAIGALTRHADLARSELARAEAPLLAHVAGLVGDPQIRHRGTLGGSLAHADPAADLPAAVAALGGTVVVSGPAGRRTLAAAELATGFLETGLAPDELLVEVRVPAHGDAGWAYEKFTRRAIDWSIVAVAVVDGRVCLAGMADRPFRATATEQALAGGASVDEAAALADEGSDPPDDLAADPEYRRHLARVLTRRALQTAAGRRRG